MSGDPSSSPALGHDSDGEDFNMTGVDEYNLLPATPMPFSPPPMTVGRNRQQQQQQQQRGRVAGGGGGGRSSNAILSSSPRLGFSDMPSTPGGGLQQFGSSQLALGGMAGSQSDMLSSQLDSMSMNVQGAGRAGSGHRRGDLGSRAQALS
ncbi:hypothetical protein IWW38_006119, partial [Coemansia aciculifera]